MQDKRRDFIKKSAALAAAACMGGISPVLAGNPVKKTAPGLNTVNMIKDAGMQLSEAYFAGMQEQKIALTRQLDVLGAVSGINTRMVGMDDAKPWEPKAITAVKEAWEKVGLKLNVIEGPPSL
ncbi:MAG TPA: twin-arginine translocation signal domain-containing protein, partial [Puia sp.]|nr:twin-arginine translocation signal domain-containing protein [Puia sp.]